VLVVLGQELDVVRNIGQVRQALACGQLCWTGKPQNPFGSAWVARPRRCLAQAASASGPSGSMVTVWPVMSTLRAASQCRRTVESWSRSGGVGYCNCLNASQGRVLAGRWGVSVAAVVAC